MDPLEQFKDGMYNSMLALKSEGDPLFTDLLYNFDLKIESVVTFVKDSKITHKHIYRM